MLFELGIFIFSFVLSLKYFWICHHLHVFSLPFLFYYSQKSGIPHFYHRPIIFLEIFLSAFKKMPAAYMDVILILLRIEKNVEIPSISLFILIYGPEYSILNKFVPTYYSKLFIKHSLGILNLWLRYFVDQTLQQQLQP